MTLLRPATDADLPALGRWRAEPEHQRLLMWRGGLAGDAEVRQWIARRSQDPAGCFRVIEHGGAPVGFVQLTDLDPAAGTCHLGLFVVAEVRGRGVAAAALAAMEEVAAARGARRVELEVVADNHRALRFYARHGYRRTGTLPGRFTFDGQALDVDLMVKHLPARGDRMLPPFPNDPARLEAMAQDPDVRRLRAELLSLMGKYKYAYNWTWHGRPIIQLPSDIVAMQMLLFAVQPDVVVETGVAHGGSLVLHASILELLGRGRVVGVDVEIRPHNRAALEAHPLAHRISLVEGSSTAAETVAQVRALVGDAARVMVLLDSDHTHAHVARELALYAPMVTPGSYLVVFDTLIEDLPASDFPDRPWGPGNNPKTAVHEFLRTTTRFEIDRELEARLLFTVAPDGFLRCVG